jgi:hypothetical protein
MILLEIYWRSSKSASMPTQPFGERSPTLVYFLTTIPLIHYNFEFFEHVADEKKLLVCG